MVKKLFIGAILFVVFIAAVIGIVFWATSGAADAADQFLALLGEGKVDQAYVSTAAAFRSQQDEASFRSAVVSMGLDGYQSASWTNRSIENSQARLEGAVTTRNGGTIPLTVSLVKEDSAWKVLAVRTPQGGALVNQTAPQIPSEEKLRELVNGTMSDFGTAVSKADFTDFYGSISQTWRQQITPAKLAVAFDPFLQGHLDLGVIRGLDPIFIEPPGLDKDGLLQLSGYYASTPVRVTFKLRYIYEQPDWKLFGIYVAPEKEGQEQGGETVARPPEEAPEAAAPASGAPNAGRTQATPVPASAAPSGAAAFTLADDPQATGRLGRIIVAFPDGTESGNTRVDVFPAGQQKSALFKYGDTSADLLPGTYDVVISEVRIPAVPVVSQKDTRIAVGVLRVRAGGNTRTNVLLGEKTVAWAYGDHDFGLPVGEYQIEISGQRTSVQIADGQVVDF